jgi:Tfp pilus assembly protein PilN
MVKIDFVPNDYIQQRDSGRANFLYLVLFGALMGAIGVTFSIIKMRQKVVESELISLNMQMSKAQEQITQLDQLRTKSKSMMKTMVMTAELLEPIPRSIVLANLTNNLPLGVSLLELKLEEKDLVVPKAAAPKPGANTYQQKAGTPAAPGKPGAPPAKPAVATAPEVPVIEKKPFETTIEIKGIAPSDLEVAGYIARLGSSILMESVNLIESKETIIDEAVFREFRLKAKLKSNIQLSKVDVEKIRKAGGDGNL